MTRKSKKYRGIGDPGQRNARVYEVNGYWPQLGYRTHRSTGLDLLLQGRPEPLNIYFNN